MILAAARGARRHPSSELGCGHPAKFALVPSAISTPGRGPHQLWSRPEPPYADIRPVIVERSSLAAEPPADTFELVQWVVEFAPGQWTDLT
jgi:hypothetical protein